MKANEKCTALVLRGNAANEWWKAAAALREAEAARTGAGRPDADAATATAGGREA